MWSFLHFKYRLLLGEKNMLKPEVAAEQKEDFPHYKTKVNRKEKDVCTGLQENGLLHN